MSDGGEIDKLYNKLCYGAEELNGMAWTIFLDFQIRCDRHPLCHIDSLP